MSPVTSFGAAVANGPDGEPKVMMVVSAGGREVARSALEGWAAREIARRLVVAADRLDS